MCIRDRYRPEDTRFTETLSGKELEEVVAVWEQWDALLSFLIATMGRDILTLSLIHISEPTRPY